MEQLNLPAYPFKVKRINGSFKIFDECRKKYVTLTPEEWVRQHFMMYLKTDLGYPISRMSCESPLLYNNLKNRADLLVYGDNKEILLLVECKASSVAIDDKVFQQVFRYNKELKAKTMGLTNGKNHFFMQLTHEEQPKFLENIPHYKELLLL